MGKIRIPFDVFCQKAVSDESFFTDAPSVENGIDRKLIKKALLYVINQELSPKQRQYVVMYYSENLNMEEIAKRCGVSKSTVSRTVSRARKNIADRIGILVKFRKTE